MSAFRSPGASPVGSDAKYKVKNGSDGQWQVEIKYYIDKDVCYRPSTRSHPELIAMIRAAKGYEGGSFVINEWSQVIVGRVDLPPAYAGEYTDILEFEVSGAKVSARPPAGLVPGDGWPGPSVGRRYALNAGGQDISYEQSFDDGTFIKARLSQAIGDEAARRLASRLARFKGTQGGVIYINECKEFFAPADKGKEKIYLGALGEDGWFPKPELP